MACADRPGAVPALPAHLVRALADAASALPPGSLSACAPPCGSLTVPLLKAGFLAATHLPVAALLAAALPVSVGSDRRLRAQDLLALPDPHA